MIKIPDQIFDCLTANFLLESASRCSDIATRHRSMTVHFVCCDPFAALAVMSSGSTVHLNSQGVKRSDLSFAVQ